VVILIMPVRTVTIDGRLHGKRSINYLARQ
jgi:hypothetical protein